MTSREDFTLWYSGDKPGRSLIFFRELSDAEMRTGIVRPRPVHPRVSHSVTDTPKK